MVKLQTFLSRVMGIGTVQRQSIVSFFGQVILTIIGFLSTIYFTHTVGASVLGSYFLFVAYLSIIGVIADGGLGESAIKRISEGKEQNSFFTAFFVLRSSLLCLIISILLYHRKYFVDINDSGMFNWMLIGLAVSIFSGTVYSGLAGSGKIGIHATANVFGDFLRILIQIIAVFLGFEVAGLIGGFIFGMLVAALIRLRFLDLKFVPFRLVHIRSLIEFSFWFFLTYGGVAVYTYADTIMIGYYLENTDVGIYKIMQQLASISLIAITAFRMTLWPNVSRWGILDRRDLIEISLSRAITYSLLLAMPIFIGGVVLGDKLIYYLYGPDFTRGYIPLMLLLFVQIINIYQIFFTMYLGALNYQKDAFLTTLSGTILNVALNFLLIPYIGILGAAIATLGGMLLNATFAGTILSKIIRIELLHREIYDMFKACAIMAFLIAVYRYLIPLSNLVLTLIPVVFGGIIYIYMILKFDQKIHDEFEQVMLQMNISLPKWL